MLETYAERRGRACSDAVEPELGTVAAVPGAESACLPLFCVFDGRRVSPHDTLAEVRPAPASAPPRHVAAPVPPPPLLPPRGPVWGKERAARAPRRNRLSARGRHPRSLPARAPPSPRLRARLRKIGLAQLDVVECGDPGLLPAALLALPLSLSPERLASLERALGSGLGGRAAAGALGGAALDVYANEGAPLDPVVLALARLPNVVCTPHIGAATAETAREVSREVAENVARVVQGGVPEDGLVVAPDGS